MLLTPSDVYPGDPAADYIHRFIQHGGVDIHYQSDLGGPYAADADSGRIWLPTGLHWRDAHSRIDRCWLFLVGGARLAPEFATPDEPRLSERGGYAPVIPLLRRPW